MTAEQFAVAAAAATAAISRARKVTTSPTSHATGKRRGVSPPPSLFPPLPLGAHGGVAPATAAEAEAKGPWQLLSASQPMRSSLALAVVRLHVTSTGRA